MKELIIKLLRKNGYRIQNITNEIEYCKIQKWSFLKGMNIKTILDIGASIGQFSEEVYNVFPDAKIYAFEPLANSYNLLIKKFEDKDRFYAYNFALGERDEEKTFYISSGSPSSSVLKMGNLHKNLFPHTATITEQIVTIKKLDNLKEIDVQDHLFIKIDVQGTEDKVILGGIDIFKKASTIVVEVSYASLYENQPLFKDIFFILNGLNFRYIGNLEQFHSPKNNVPLFSDAIFVSDEFYEKIYSQCIVKQD